MQINVKANELKNSQSSIKGLATVTFGKTFRLRSIPVMESRDGKLFVSMPSYKTKAKDEQGRPVYKDICNPITKDFREQLYNAVIESFQTGKEVNFGEKDGRTEPSINVKATALDVDNGATKGLARLYIEDAFVVNNVTVKESKDGELFMSMPSYKTNQVDEQGKAVYKDVAYPTTKEFRAALQEAVIEKFQESKEMKLDEALGDNPFVEGMEPKEVKAPSQTKEEKKEPKKEKSSIKEKIAQGEAKKEANKAESKQTPKKSKEAEIA